MLIIITVIFLVILCIYLLLIYNSLVSLRQQANEAWSDIDVQLRRRHDLIPNLVSVVKSYEKYEKDLLIEVTELRKKAISLDQDEIQKKYSVESSLEKSLKTLFAVAENYPDLKANSEFLKLQSELTTTEDEIASSRRIYNSNAADYNIKIQSFPAQIIAQQFKFQPHQYFKDEDEKTVPDTNLASSM